jgi:hypothetical protein
LGDFVFPQFFWNVPIFHRSLALGQSANCKEGGTFHLERFMAYSGPR